MRSILLFVVLATPLAAQAPAGVTFTGDATVDSAAVARMTYRAAVRAEQPKDGLPGMHRAAVAWPMQPFYWQSLARVAANARDSVEMRFALDGILAFGLGGALLDDERVANMLRTDQWTSRREALARNRAPLGAGRVLRTIADTNVFAEGIDADRRTGTLYVASIRQRTVFAVDAKGVVRDLGLGQNAELGAILGVRVSLDGRSLYATTAPQPAAGDSINGRRAMLLQVAVATGAIERAWPLPEDGRTHTPGDLAVADDGTVIVSDSDAPVLWLLRKGAAEFDTITDVRFRSLQGIAIEPGSRRAIVADYSHGLFAVDLHTKAVQRIADAPNATVLGIDGLVPVRDGVVGVQNGVEPARVVHVVMDDARTRILRVDVLDRQPEFADEPTIATRLGDEIVYVGNSQWNEYDAKGERRPGTALAPTRLIAVPLPASARGAAR